MASPAFEVLVALLACGVPDAFQQRPPVGVGLPGPKVPGSALVADGDANRGAGLAVAVEATRHRPPSAALEAAQHAIELVLGHRRRAAILRVHLRHPRRPIRASLAHAQKAPKDRDPSWGERSPEVRHEEAIWPCQPMAR